jgi:tripartite ATP-independent transporter DctP family solute receptor
MQTNWSGALIGALLVVLAVPAHAERTFRMASPWPTSSTPHAGVARFVQEVEKLSKGQLKVQLYPDAQLGDIQAEVTGVQTGTIDMAYLGVANAAVLKGGGALNVLYVPYLFKNKQVVPEIVNSPMFQEVYDSLARESNVRIFASYGSRLPRACNTVKGPIIKPADLKGMKIRVPPVEVMRATWERLGAKPVIMGLGDIYMALSRGQIEGQENGIDAVIGYKWYEVTKYYSPLEQTFEVASYYISEKVWQTLTPEEKDILVRAAKLGGESMTKAGEDLEKQGLETMKQHGLTISQPDREAFKEALKDVYKPYEGKLWPVGLVDKIRAMQK